MKLKIKTVIFLPDVIGGVSTVIHNYLKEADFDIFEFFVVKIEDTDNVRSKINFVFPNAENINFKYSHFENTTFVLNRLYKLLPDKTAVIIATDSLELQMTHSLKLKNKVVFLLLGDFKHYYNLAINHQDIIDKYIAITYEIQDNIKKFLPKNIKKIKMCRFPVPEIVSKNTVSDNSLRVIFVGRLETGKGVKILPDIDKSLKKSGTTINWTIVGDGDLKTEIIKRTANAPNFSFKGFLSYSDLLEEYKNHDVYFLPSKSEGLPISLIESMKTGLVPVVSNISGGIREVILSGKNGFLVDPEDFEAFASVFKLLNTNKKLRENLRNEAIASTINTFNPKINARLFFDELKAVTFENKQTNITLPFKQKNRLDSPWFPNFFVTFIRKAMFHIKSAL